MKQLFRKRDLSELLEEAKNKSVLDENADQHRIGDQIPRDNSREAGL